MGGFAAKQRRRLERQSLQPSTEQTSVETLRTKASSLKEHPRKQNKTTTTTEQRATKKKVQKPKHLKRKLEALNSGEVCLSEEEQELLRRQMKEFEIIKGKPMELSSDLNESKSSVNKRQQEKLQKSSSRESETEPSLELKDVESSIGEDNVKTNGDDSDEEVELNLTSSRQRGKRRRGRKDISDGSVSKSDVETPAEPMEYSIVSTKSDEMKFGSNNSEGDELSSRNSSSSVGKSPLEIPKKDSSNVRRCIGRKPVTDFIVGQCYSGKVVYAKPFGVFFDIGCHSDAFCHVSQLSDRFIESPIEAFPVGQMIENSIRVIAIDRRKKRLTVSLQPSSNNKSSERLQMRSKPSESRDTVSLDDDSRSRIFISAESGSVSSHDIAPIKNDSFELKNVKELTSSEQQKRARKIARRAQRRAERDQ